MTELHDIAKVTFSMWRHLGKNYTDFLWDVPGRPLVSTSPSNGRVARLISGQGGKIPPASWLKNTKQKQYCNKFNKDFYKVHIKKNLKKNYIDFYMHYLHLVQSIST